MFLAVVLTNFMLSLDKFFSIVVVIELVGRTIYFFDSLGLSGRATFLFFMSLLRHIEYEIIRALEEHASIFTVFLLFM